MKQAQALNGIVIGGAVSLLAAQPVWAAATQVTAVQLNPSGSELQLVLETKAGDTRPQIFTVHRGNELVTDILNTQLSLSKGESFRQENPMPGVTALVVSQLDANRVRVTVSGTKSAPTGQILQSNPQAITLGISTAQNKQAAVSNTGSLSPPAPASPGTPTLQSPSTPTPAAQAPNSPQTVAQIPTTAQPVQSTPTAPASSTIPILQTQPSTMPAAQTQNPPTTITQTPTPQPIQPAQTPSGPTVVPQAPVTAPNPDVLVPNPKITIDGVAAPATGAMQPVAPAPPFLPRAIAPPVGDIAISNINASANHIDLGTDARVPRLVLREAPVREVLSLLARSAGLNVAFTDGGSAPGAPPGGAAGGQQTISLDLENESVQDVFNYVLQISGLQANRVGRTILVGSRLPDAARNIVARTLRLNQVRSVDAVGFLIAQGAEQQQITKQTTLTVVGEGAAAQRIENTTTTVQKIAPQVEQAQAQGATAAATGPLTLRGLLVTPDERLNQLTLVGEPRQVEIATALLNQLDLRRRQVAVNVKVVDVNLSGTDAFNSSFSFGIGNAFFVNDNGAASFNYGGTRPPTSLEVQSSLASPTVIPGPYQNVQPFIDLNRTINIPGGGGFTVDRRGNIVAVNGTAFKPVAPFGPNGSPLDPGFLNSTPGTPPSFANGVTTPGTPGTVTYSLPTLFQFPKKLLAALQAQIQSGNAKILTDPTLVVQEGQTATVNLTQEVVGNIRSETQSTTNQTTRTVTAEIREAGLILEINVRKIDDNGFVNLTVNPRVTSIGDRQDLSIDSNTNRIALLNVRQLSSGEIRLRDAQTLILSGIIQDIDRTTVKKVPLLGDIPLLGALFRSTSRENQRQEVIVLLTPQIINDSEGSSFGYNYTPGREAREVLQRQGLPPGGNK